MREGRSFLAPYDPETRPRSSKANAHGRADSRDRRGAPARCRQNGGAFPCLYLGLFVRSEINGDYRNNFNASHSARDRAWTARIQKVLTSVVSPVPRRVT